MKSSHKVTSWSLKKLPRSFYLRPTITVAQDLLGKYIIRKLGRQRLIGKIVETEAYGERDPASHSYRGKTKRNEVMFWEGGHLYVYFTYGMHFCANVVTGPEGRGEAVLIRAVEPIDGIEAMVKKRTTPLLTTLTDGPAKFCQAFGIGRKENGIDLLGDEIYITNGERIPRSRIGKSIRIGITNGKEKKWRFFVSGNTYVSR